jgi:dolichyl-phosphate-mannose--protein O-mannosyl transferase
MGLDFVDCLIVVFLFFSSFFARIFNIHFPESLVFDEIHFTSFIQKYHQNKFFFDIHPPFAKLLLYFFSVLSNQQLSVQHFQNIVFLRILVSLFSSF